MKRRNDTSRDATVDRDRQVAAVDCLIRAQAQWFQDRGIEDGHQHLLQALECLRRHVTRP